MSFSKVGRPAKGQLRCNICKAVCLPKNGDWFVSQADGNQQVFLCRKCEIDAKDAYKRAIPIK